MNNNFMDNNFSEEFYRDREGAHALCQQSIESVWPDVLKLEKAQLEHEKKRYPSDRMARQRSYNNLQSRSAAFAYLLRRSAREHKDDHPLGEELRKAIDLFLDDIHAHLLSHDGREPSKEDIVPYLQRMQISPEAKEDALKLLHDQWENIIAATAVFAQFQKQDMLAHGEGSRFGYRQPLLQGPEHAELCVIILQEYFFSLLRERPGADAGEERASNSAFILSLGIMGKIALRDRELSERKAGQATSSERRKLHKAAKLAEASAPISPPSEEVRKAATPKVEVPKYYELHGDAARLLHNAQGVAGMVSDKSRPAKMLIEAIEETQHRLDRGNADHKAVGDVLLSAGNIAFVAHALGIGKSIQAPGPVLSPRDVRAIQNKFAALHAQPQTHALVDALFEHPSSRALLLLAAGMTCDGEKCRDVAAMEVPDKETPARRLLRISDERRVVSGIRDSLLGPVGHAANGYAARSSTAPQVEGRS